MAMAAQQSVVFYTLEMQEGQGRPGVEALRQQENPQDNPSLLRDLI